MNTLFSLAAISLGATLGAWLRWGLSLLFNPMFPMIPLGTLLANCLGGYLIGVATAFFEYNTLLSPQIRLLIITGFLGGLTTFSTFSSEVVNLLSRHAYISALGCIMLHLFGSLSMTMLGMATVERLH